MKWLFRIIAFILLAFAGLCVAGYFLPSKQVMVASAMLEADRDSVYEIVSDLRSYPDWSGIGGPDSEWVFAGAPEGAGQTAAWQAGSAFGSVEILQSSAGEFVLVHTVGPLGEQKVTLALSQSQGIDGMTDFLIEAQRDVGGFPYFGRVAALRQGMKTQAALEQATAGLSEITSP